MSEREIVVITGGARSGKSRIALEVAGREIPKVFIATCEPFDEEIRSRIRKHKEERCASWITMEEPVLIARILQQQTGGVVLIDCMTLWLSNLLVREKTDDQISALISELCEATQRRKGLTILVTNETGMGIVPDNPLARRFRDLAGIMN
ncbi:MAG: bifunctional adenosylcobinamide kinase/adenosylcobinamide-phosphate guanylyltransferase, partial [Acidobacteriota bacterium]